MTNVVNEIAIRPFATTTNALAVFKKAPAHKRALKKVKGLFRRKPKTVKKSAQELGRSVAHAVKTAHPAAQVAMAVTALGVVGLPAAKIAQRKTLQLGLEGQTVMVKPEGGREGVIGEIVSAGRTTDPLGRDCLVVVDDAGHTHSFAMDECTVVDLRDREVDIRKNARRAMPFGDGREAFKAAAKNRKELRDLQPVFVTGASSPKTAKSKTA